MIILSKQYFYILQWKVLLLNKILSFRKEINYTDEDISKNKKISKLNWKARYKKVFIILTFMSGMLLALALSLIFTLGQVNIYIICEFI